MKIGSSQIPLGFHFIVHREKSGFISSCVLTIGMCFPMILWLIEFLPYLWVVTVPVYGSFCGIDLILRISILLYLYCIAGEVVPKSMVNKRQVQNVSKCEVIYL